MISRLAQVGGLVDLRQLGHLSRGGGEMGPGMKGWSMGDRVAVAVVVMVGMAVGMVGGHERLLWPPSRTWCAGGRGCEAGLQTVPGPWPLSVSWNTACGNWASTSDDVVVA